MVAWSGNETYCQVLVDRPQPETVDLAAMYPEVPENKRPSHHRAVSRLRQMGASVDAFWGQPNWDPRGQEWRFADSTDVSFPFTAVYLSGQWRGGDEGLKLLADVHGLRMLFLIQADVSNEGLRYIATLDGMDSLHLVETSVTDDGLVHLREHKGLQYLRLEGTAGGSEFTDTGLASLAGIRIHRLALHGNGFTERSCVHLGEIEELHSLILYDTGIPDDALRGVKGNDRLINWQRRPCNGRCSHSECYSRESPSP